MSAEFEILGVGAVAVDEILRVASYPGEDTKVRVTAHERRFGGLVGNALAAAARLGACCAYAGVLGDDADSRFVREALESEGIDQSTILHDPAARPFHGTIVISESSGSRTVLSRLACPGTTQLKELPRARVILIDHHFPASACAALAQSRAAGAQVVADLERSHERSGALEALSDHLIVPRAYASARTGQAEPHLAAAALWELQRRLVVVTDGAAGCWFTEDGVIQHQGVFPVDAIETNGCGDVFHGAYAWAALQGCDLRERVRIASIAAAVKASGRGLTALRRSADLQALSHRCASVDANAASRGRPGALSTVASQGCRSHPP
jgi:sulfofructose kinase